MEHHVSEEALDAFWPSRNSMEHLRNLKAFYGRCGCDRFSVVDHCGDGVKPVCSLCARAHGTARLAGTPLLPSSGLMLLTKALAEHSF